MQSDYMHKHIYLLFFCALLCLSACSPRNYEGLPSLPQRDWLNTAEKSQTEESSNAEDLQIYAPDKTHTFEDLVYLAIQQSPVISRGSINLEVQEIVKRDAKWKYLPEMHLLYTITNNITQYNKGDKRYAREGYGETKYQVAYSGRFQNPVATYFTVQAQDELMQVAVVTQRKAIGEVIRNIAETLLLMDQHERSISLLEEQLAVAVKKQDAEHIREKYQKNLLNPASLSEDHVQDLELRLRETRMELTLERSRLKQLVGLNMEQKLSVDAHSVYDVLNRFQPQNLRWQDCWERTDDRYLLRQQVRLEEANIMLAWAQYTPNINIVFNENAPNGQSQPTGAKTDTFLHLTFDFPLLDWGSRYRKAAMSRARKRQRQLDEIQRQREFGQRWLRMEMELVLAEARAERRRHAVDSAARRHEAVHVSYANAAADMRTLAQFQQTELDRRLAALEAENAVASARLAWMYFSSELSTHFLGNSGRDGANS